MCATITTYFHLGRSWTGVTPDGLPTLVFDLKNSGPQLMRIECDGTDIVLDWGDRTLQLHATSGQRLDPESWRAYLTDLMADRPECPECSALETR